MDVALRITGVPSAADATRKRLPFSSVVGRDIVIPSPLAAGTSINEHLVWFWSSLKHERRYLKSLSGQGAVITVQARNVRGQIEVKPNGAEMLHLLGASLLINPR